jgi:hypothetical protein
MSPAPYHLPLEKLPKSYQWRNLILYYKRQLHAALLDNNKARATECMRFLEHNETFLQMLCERTEFAHYFTTPTPYASAIDSAFSEATEFLLRSTPIVEVWFMNGQTHKHKLPGADEEIPDEPPPHGAKTFSDLITILKETNS